MPASGPPRVPVLPCPSPAAPDHPSLVSSPHVSSIPQSTNPPGPRSPRRPRCHCSTLSPLPALTTRVARVTRSHVGMTPNHAERSGWEPLCCAAQACVLFPLTSLPASTSFLVCHLPHPGISASVCPFSGHFDIHCCSPESQRSFPLMSPGDRFRAVQSAPATRGSLSPQREALCQEHFLSGSDLLLLAAAEAGWGRGTRPGGVLVLVGVGGSRCIGASLVNLEIPGPVSTALPSHPLRLLSSPPAEGQTGGLQN